MLEYDELRIRIWKTGTRRYLVLANGAAGAAAERVTLAKPPEDYLARLDGLFQAAVGGSAAAEASCREDLKALGRELFGQLLPGALQPCLSACLQQAQGRQRGLRLRFDLDPELTSLPLEALCSGADSPLGPLALQPGLSLVRSLRGQPQNPLRSPTAEEAHGPLRLILVAPAPSGLPALDQAAEIAAIERSVPPALRLGGANPVEVLSGAGRGSRVTLQRLQDLVQGQPDRPAVVLLSAHAEYDPEQKEVLLSLEAADGRPAKVPAHLLASTLAAAPALRLVVLNLCLGARALRGEPFSGFARSLVAAGIPAVVAMQTVVTDAGALAFSPALLGALLRNRSIDEGLFQARQAITLAGVARVEWSTPALFFHADYGYGWLFKVIEAQVGPEPLADPLRHYQALLRQVQRAPNVQDIDRLVPFLRCDGQWQEVATLAAIAGAAQPGEAAWKRLALEAGCELALAECRGLLQSTSQRGGAERVAVLEDLADPGARRRRLPALQERLPEEVLEGLEAELAEAVELDALDHQARSAEQRQDWPEAIGLLSRVLEARPLGYRDALARRDRALEDQELAQLYEQAEGALDRGDWNGALEPLARVLGRRPGGYRQAWAGQQYALARLAEGRRPAPGRPEGGRAEARAWAEVAGLYAEILRAEGAYRDSEARALYAEAREAEAEAGWASAAKRFKAKVLGGFSDSLKRGAYAAGRLAESGKKSLSWTKAAAEFRAAGDFHDARNRLAYSLGRAAEAGENWQEALNGFGTLADSYRQGEVGRRRAYARARLAEGSEPAEERWARALEALSEVGETERSPEVAGLWHYARAREAERVGDWALAAEELGHLSEGTRDVAWRRPWVSARQAEQQEDWQRVVELLTPVLAQASAPPEDFEDLPWLCLFAQGCCAEGRGLWEKAARCFAEVPRGFRDVSRRRDYAEARVAESQGDWRGVLDLLGELPAAWRDVEAWAAYASGRLEARAGQWAQAAEWFRQSRALGSAETWEARHAEIADATARRGYCLGRYFEQRGEWSRALACFREIDPPLEDSGQRRERLERLLEALPWLDGLGVAGLVADPYALRSGRVPYAALAPAGVGPASSMAEIRQASFALMSQGALGGAVRQAWNALRDRASRLRIDASLYRLRQPARLLACLQELSPEAAEPPLEQLCCELPEDAPLLRLLDGRADQALELWRERLCRQPLDFDSAFLLANAASWRSRQLEADGAHEQAERILELGLAVWARLITEDAPWPAWGEEAGRRLGEPLQARDLGRLRRDLRQGLIAELDRQAAELESQGKRLRAGVYHQLRLSFEAELEGARLLQEAGGLPMGDDEAAHLSSGLLYLRHFGLAAALARFVAEREAASTAPAGADSPAGPAEEGKPGLEPAQLFRLRCAFSRLAVPWLLLERGQPEAALALLPPPAATGLSEHAGREGDCAAPELERAHLAACRPCAELAFDAPAYLGLAGRRARLFQDEVELAVRAQLALAEAALAAGASGLAAARERWGAALEQARRSGTQVRTRQAIALQALGRVEALCREWGKLRGQRLSDSLALLTAASERVGKADEGRLLARQAEVLTDRGIWYGYGCHEFESPDRLRAAVDLRQALALTPGSVVARDNLARALIFEAAKLGLEGGPNRPFQLLAEALEVLHQGLERHPGHRGLRWVLNQALETLEQHLNRELDPKVILAQMEALRQGPAPASADGSELDRHLRRAQEAEQRGDLWSALMARIAALRSEPGDSGARSALLAAVAARAQNEGAEPGGGAC